MIIRIFTRREFNFSFFCRETVQSLDYHVKWKVCCLFGPKMILFLIYREMSFLPEKFKLHLGPSVCPSKFYSVRPSARHLWHWAVMLLNHKSMIHDFRSSLLESFFNVSIHFRLIWKLPIFFFDGSNIFSLSKKPMQGPLLQSDLKRSMREKIEQVYHISRNMNLSIFHSRLRCVILLNILWVKKSVSESKNHFQLQYKQKQLAKVNIFQFVRSFL